MTLSNLTATQRKVLEILREELSAASSDALDKVTLTTTLSDLGMDSLDLTTAVIVIEERLGVVIPDDRIIQIDTFGELCAAVDELAASPIEIAPAQHVYATAPDGRLNTSVTSVSRFRPQYRGLTDDEKKLHDALKAKAVELEDLFNQVKPGTEGRYKTLAFDTLEQSIMWIVKDLTA